mgnify:CR=1 FL=1
MGISDWSLCGSDNAADAVFNLESVIAKCLEEEMTQEGNEYNTNGIENVAMIFDECIISSFYWRNYGERLKKLAQKVIRGLQEQEFLVLEKYQKEKNNEIEDYLKFNRHICGRLKKFIGP